jgi:hypothetical protein
MSVDAIRSAGDYYREVIALALKARALVDICRSVFVHAKMAKLHMSRLIDLQICRKRSGSLTRPAGIVTPGIFVGVAKTAGGAWSALRFEEPGALHLAGN